MKKWLSKFVQLAKQALVRHPVEILLVTFCLFPLFTADLAKTIEHYDDYFVWLPIALMLVNLTHGSKYYRLSVIIPIALVLLVKFFDIYNLIGDERLFSLTLAVIVVFLCQNAEKNNRTFMFGVAHKLLNCIFAGLIAMLFGIVVSGLTAAIDGLFHVNMIGFDIYERLWFISGVWIFPVAYLSLLQREGASDQLQSDFGKILLNWILSPALVIYTLIIYAYAAFILVQGKMPEGIIANVAFPYLVVGIALYVIQTLLDKEKWQKFYRLLPWLNLLPLAMLWYAASIRIHHYGFTQERVYLVMGAVVLALCNLILLVPKIRQYRLLAGVVLLALLSNSSIIDASKIAYKDQLARFDAFVRAQQLLDDNGKLSGERIEQWLEKNKSSESYLIDEFRELHYAVLLDTATKWTEEFKQQYGIPKIENAYRWMLSDSSSIYSSSYFRIGDIEAQSMDIEDYNHLHWFENYVSRNNDYGVINSDNVCRIHRGRIMNLQGEPLDNIYVECQALPSRNYHQDFVLAFQPNDSDVLLEWNLDEYLRNLFVSHNLVIHEKYTDQELNVLKNDFKSYIELDNRIILFTDFNIAYVERDNYKGYVFEQLTLKGVLSK